FMAPSGQVLCSRLLQELLQHHIAIETLPCHRSCALAVPLVIRVDALQRPRDPLHGRKTEKPPARWQHLADPGLLRDHRPRPGQIRPEVRNHRLRDSFPPKPAVRKRTPGLADVILDSNTIIVPCKEAGKMQVLPQLPEARVDVRVGTRRYCLSHSRGRPRTLSKSVKIVCGIFSLALSPI